MENWPYLAPGSDFVTTEQHEHGFFLGRLFEDLFCAERKPSWKNTIYTIKKGMILRGINRKKLDN